MPDNSEAISEATSEALEQAVADPQAATVDGQSVDARPLPDLIAADKYAKARAALRGANANGGPRSGWNALRPAQAVYGGDGG
jgi:hypothetical protein